MVYLQPMNMVTWEMVNGIVLPCFTYSIGVSPAPQQPNKITMISPLRGHQDPPRYPDFRCVGQISVPNRRHGSTQHPGSAAESGGGGVLQVFPSIGEASSFLGGQHLYVMPVSNSDFGRASWAGLHFIIYSLYWLVGEPPL